MSIPIPPGIRKALTSPPSSRYKISSIPIAFNLHTALIQGNVEGSRICYRLDKEVLERFRQPAGKLSLLCFAITTKRDSAILP
ncbi:MAG: hypothetical protein V1844_16240 [Pseudomonadota bacterium]